jgi:hypothetical protein
MTKKEIDNLKEGTIYEQMTKFSELIKINRESKATIRSYFLSKYPYLKAEINDYNYWP